MSSSLIAMVVAPLLYTAVGLPWATRLGFRAPLRAAPLLGCLVFGFAAELALITGLPPVIVVALVLVASGALWATRRELPNRAHLRELALAYAAAALATAASPFPVLGNWAGDWFHAFDAGRAILGGAFGPAHLSRPPLFGGAMLPLALVLPPFTAFQAMSAVASAGAATATLEAAERFGARGRMALALPLLLSVFFLHHAAAAWPKLLAGGLVVLALSRIDRAEASTQWPSAALMAAAVAVHEGSIVWIPLWALLAIRRVSLSGVVKPLLTLGAFGALLVAPYVLWSVLRFGLAARVSANPVVTDRSSDSFGFKVFMLAVSTVVGWSPILNLRRWLSAPAPMSSSVVAKEVWWLITSTLTVAAGSLLGVVLPWLVAARTRLGALLQPVATEPRRWALGVGLATLLTGMLTPFYSDEGSLQVAHVPLALLFFALAMAAASEQSLGRWTVATLCLGALPWVAFNASVTLLLRFSPSFEQRFRVGSEGDYPRIVAESIRSVGMSTFPVLLVVAISAGWLLVRRDRAAQVAA